MSLCVCLFIQIHTHTQRKLERSFRAVESVEESDRLLDVSWTSLARLLHVSYLHASCTPLTHLHTSYRWLERILRSVETVWGDPHRLFHPRLSLSRFPNRPSSSLPSLSLSFSFFLSLSVFSSSFSLSSHSHSPRSHSLTHTLSPPFCSSSWREYLIC